MYTIRCFQHFIYKLVVVVVMYLPQVENSLSTYEPHGCVIVYSVVNRSSFRQAEEIVKYLWRENLTKEKAVILVGNKADLARSRVIPSAEGKALAKSIDAKFIETSSGIQHNVDELLVGILKQVSACLSFSRFLDFFPQCLICIYINNSTSLELSALPTIDNRQ